MPGAIKPGGRPGGGGGPGRPGGGPGGMRPGGGSGDDEKSGKGILDLAKRIGIVVVVLIALAFFAFRGCSIDLGNTVNLSGGGSSSSSAKGGSGGGVFSGLMKSKHTTAEDRQNFAVLQDINGNSYTTVIELVPQNVNKVSVGDLKARLEGFRWYQLIALADMGAGYQMTAHVYFPADVSLSDMFALAEALSADGTYSVKVMSLDEYNAYLASPDLDNIYYNETTYYGPAATS